MLVRMRSIWPTIHSRDYSPSFILDKKQRRGILLRTVFPNHYTQLKAFNCSTRFVCQKACEDKLIGLVRLQRTIRIGRCILSLPIWPTENCFFIDAKAVHRATCSRSRSVSEDCSKAALPRPQTILATFTCLPQVQHANLSGRRPQPTPPPQVDLCWMIPALHDLARCSPLRTAGFFNCS